MQNTTYTPPKVSTCLNSKNVTICDNASELIDFCEKSFSMTHVDIAKLLGISSGAVKRNKKTGRLKLSIAIKLSEFIDGHFTEEQSEVPVKVMLQEFENQLEKMLVEVKTLKNRLP